MIRFLAKLMALCAMMFFLIGIWLVFTTQNQSIATATALEANVKDAIHSPHEARPLSVEPNIQIALEAAFSGFTSRPTKLIHADDGTDRIYVVQQDGLIRYIENYQNTPKTTFLDIRNQVSCCSEQTGLLSLAFPPDYENKDHFYVFYTDKGRDGDPDVPIHIVISRFSLQSGQTIADPNSEEKILELELTPDGFEHKGGFMDFGPDGYLYLGIGDSGDDHNSRDLGTLFGKILRIDVETGNPATYTIPNSNPFTNTPGALGEIWSYGVRQPWTGNFDTETGDLYWADVGKNEREEINFEAANTGGGLNFGYNCLEGTLPFRTNGDCSDSNYLDTLIPPIAEFAHTGSSHSVIGGFVYRGTQYPDLEGHYFYADQGTGRIWSMYKTGADSWSTPKLQLDTDYSIPAFGIDQNDEIYVLRRNNSTIYRIIDFNQTGINLSTSEKMVSTSHADTGEVVTYTIVVENTGGLSGGHGWLTDTIPAGLNYKTGTLQATHGTVDDTQSPTLYWDGDLSTIKLITITYEVTVTESDGILINNAALTGGEVNPPSLSASLIVPRPGPDTTTLKDFFLPGTQPNNLVHEIADPASCGSCHTAPIYSKWRGSMMSQSGRDPLMWAALFVANNDAPNSGDFCLRCHTAKGWMEGRSTPTDGSSLTDLDISSGVACEVCHRMVDPVASTTDQAVAIDATIRSALTSTLPSDYVGTAMLILDPEDRRRGPFALPVEPPHVFSPTLQTDFFDQAGHNEDRSRLCGSCHNVDNPALSWDEARQQYWPNGNDMAAPSFDRGDIFPIERTFEEWRNSSYLTGVYAPEFAGAKPDGMVAACQDCHMSRTTGSAAAFGEPVDRDCETTGCLPAHEFFGGNAWVPQILQDPRWRLASPDTEELNSTIVNARLFLQKSATMTTSLVVSGTDKIATVRVINETGHKLPTGYPEGRRMWVNLRAYDVNDNLIFESGVYTDETAVLDKDDPTIKIYETKLGVTPELAAEYNLADLPTGGESFHFVLNNVILKDNRIPPRGFTNEAFDEPGMRPIGATYADGQYWDDTTYIVPLNTARIEATLYYQTSSKEYIDFLRENGGPDGETLGLLWDDLKSPPEWVVSSVYPKPVTDVTLNHMPSPAMTQETVTFTAAVSPISHTETISYTWQFGDGSATAVTTVPTATHLYTAGGHYTATVTAVNATGQATDSQAVTIIEPVAATSFVAQPTLTKPDDAILFTATISPVNATQPVTLTWQFSDNTPLVSTTTHTLTHVYDAAGEYTIILTATNAGGQAHYSDTVTILNPITEVNFTTSDDTLVEDNMVTFNVVLTDSHEMLPITYRWQFGDGSPIQTTTTMSQSHVYTTPGQYTVVMTASNGVSQVTTDQTILVTGVGLAVTEAGFTFTPSTNIATNVAIDFTANITPLEASVPQTYTWNFGDGTETESTANTATHTFTQPGSYPVQLTVANPFGQATTQQQITVGVGLNTVSFDHTPSAPQTSDDVIFTALALPANADLPITYQWDFGDGTTTETSVNTTTHTFTDGGTYTVSLVATNNLGQVMAQEIVTVLQAIDTVDIQIQPATASPTALITFTAQISPSDATLPITYQWHFGDGTISNESSSQVITHTYAVSDTYTVSLTATNDAGQATTFKDINVFSEISPEPDLKDMFLPVILK